MVIIRVEQSLYKQDAWRRLREMPNRRKHIALNFSFMCSVLLQSVCTNKQACGRKAVACIEVATGEMWNLRSEV